MEKFNNKQIITMMALSEEVNSLNFKLQELLKGLDALPDTLEQVQSISKSLNNKIDSINENANGYTPIEREKVAEPNPSYKEAGNKQTRLEHKYEKPKNIVPPVKEDITKFTEEAKPIPPKNKKVVKPPKRVKKSRRGLGGSRKPLGNNKNAKQ